MRYLILIFLLWTFLTVGQEDISANKTDISAPESAQEFDSASADDTDSEKFSKEELEFLFNQELEVLSNVLAEQSFSEQTDDSSVQDSSFYLLQDKDTAFSPDSSSVVEMIPYDRDILYNHWGPFYPSDRFCFDRYPYWGWHRSCSYGVPLWSAKITFKKRKNTREKYQEYLFDQAYGGSIRSPFVLGIRYKEGFGGFPTDLSKAYAWFSIALGRGYSSAQYMIDQITDEMTQAQMDKSEDIINSILETSKQVREERLKYIRGLKDSNHFQ